MKKTFAVSLVAAVAYCLPVYAEQFDSNIEMSGAVSSVKNNKSKLSEYSDTSGGVTANITIDKYTSDGSILIKAENIGINSELFSSRKDQSLSFKSIGDFSKLYVYYDETPHALTLGAKTLYSGVGTTALSTAYANNASAATALAAYTNTFDYRMDRITPATKLINYAA